LTLVKLEARRAFTLRTGTGERHMALTAKQLQDLRKRIEDRSRALAAEVRKDAGREREEQYGELAGSTHDTGDESIADLLADLDHAELTRDLQELRDLEAARQRLAAGTYGQCIDCGGEIGVERLRANPAALRCVACQQQYEKTHAAPGTPSL
jgi:RNA polymerase-binding transcription factor DksA